MAIGTFADGALASEVRGKLNAVINAIDSLNKASVGLANVDNTSDANKPISTAVAAALAAIDAALTLLDAQKLGVADLDVSDLLAGEQKIMTIRKNIADEPEIGEPILLVDRYAPLALVVQLDPANAWVNFKRVLTGTNTAGELGVAGQTIVTSDDRLKYDCILSDDASATWKIRFNTQLLEPGNSAREDDIIALLESASGWVANFKTINTKNCFVGEHFHDSDEEGYYYECLEQTGTSFLWKRVAHTPQTLELYFTASEKATLCAAIDAHDFDVNGWYDQSGLSIGDQAQVGRRYVDTANEHVYEVVTVDMIARLI